MSAYDPIVADAIGRGLAKHVAPNLIEVPLPGGGTLVTLEKVPCHLPDISDATLEHLAKHCGILRDRRGYVHFFSPRGDTTCPGKLRSFADRIAQRAKGEYREKVDEEFTWRANHGATAEIRKDALAVLLWLQIPSSCVPDGSCRAEEEGVGDGGSR